MGGQLTYRHFPVRQAELASETEFIDLKEGQLDLGDGMVVTTKYLNHPVLCLGYRFHYRGKVLCTAYDTEPFQNVFCTDPQDPGYDETMALEGEEVAREQNRQLEAFFEGSDLLIHDTQYTQAEYESSRVGWGHTPLEYAISAANRNGVKRMALFHHDPMRTDGQIDEMREIFCNGNGKGPTEVFFAVEGTELEL